MPSATLPKVSSSGRRSHTSGVVVRGPCHRVAREESGSNPHARVLCPSVATASCLIPRPASCSWWHAFRRAERHGSGSPPPRAGLHSPRRRFDRRVRRSRPSCLLNQLRQSLPYESLVASLSKYRSFASLRMMLRAQTPAKRDHFFALPAAAFFAAFNGSTVVAPANPRRSRGGCFAF